MKELVVAREQDVPPGRCRVVEAAGRRFALFNVEGALFATANTCLHRGGSLGDGSLEGNVVTCPLHGWTYDVTTGDCSRADDRLATVEVRVADGDVRLVLPE